MKKLLIILTSRGTLASSDRKTGLWLSTFSDAYYTFVGQGYEVTVASPEGGRPPIDPLSEETQDASENATVFRDDYLSQLELGNTWRIDDVDVSMYDAVYIADGHGAMWDIASSKQIGRLLYQCFLEGKPVAMVGHGVAALVNFVELRPNALKGLRVTCFTDTEEALLKRHHDVPFSLTDWLKEQGVQFGHAIVPFTPYVTTDGFLITGQNPASALPVAQALVEKMEEVYA